MLAKSVASKTGTVVRKAEQIGLPKELTHYTDLTGLKGIIEKREFWLSNAGFLNDPEELSHGIKMAARVLNSLLKRARSTDVVARGRKKLVSDIAKDFEGFKPPDAYITCFCERRDLLSQWRGYSSRQGISITFNTFGLTDVFGGTGAEIQQVHYGMAATRQQLTAHIERELPDIVDDFDYMMGDLKDTELRQSFSILLASLVPRFKHFGFREEKEWRLVVMNPDRDRIEFRPRAQLMLPYLKLVLNVQKLPVERVTIGPGIQDAAVSRSIEFFLEANGYDPSLVSSSSTPYRS